MGMSSFEIHGWSVSMYLAVGRPIIPSIPKVYGLGADSPKVE
jgi:hypothetical protein